MANHITEVISRDLKLNIRSINFSSLANGCIGGTVSVEVPGAGAWTRSSTPSCGSRACSAPSVSTTDSYHNFTHIKVNE